MVSQIIVLWVTFFNFMLIYGIFRNLRCQIWTLEPQIISALLTDNTQIAKIDSRAPSYVIRPVLLSSYSPTTNKVSRTTPTPLLPCYTQSRPLSTTFVRLPLATCPLPLLLPSPPTPSPRRLKSPSTSMSILWVWSSTCGRQRLRRESLILSLLLLLLRKLFLRR